MLKKWIRSESGPTLKKILFVVNAPGFFVSHRLAIAEKAKSLGYEVHVASTSVGTDGFSDASSIRVIENEGFPYHEIYFSRGGQNPFVEFLTMTRLFILMRKVRPDLVHLVTIKPVIYGGIAARVTGVSSVVAAISGLGTVFMARSAVARLRRWLISRLYTTVFGHRNLKAIFQNPDDRNALIGLGLLHQDQARVIRGSGVHLSDYPCLPEPTGRLVVAMAARLLKAKGVCEFVEAARLLHDRGVDVEMRLIGSPDPGNPTSVTHQDIERWANDQYVRLLGFRNDIAQQYSQAHIVCLPSYYPEGLPKSLIEAAACGRAVVTTDMPGCRDAITPDITGILVPIKDPVALADAIQQLAGDSAKRKSMGAAGRVLAEEAFTIESIAEQHMCVYRELLGNE